MNDYHPFVDYYDVLQVNPSCDAKFLEAAYHYLAKMYHPDHPDTANTEKFSEVIEAYRALKDPGLRAKYDLAYYEIIGERSDIFPSSDEFVIEEEAAINDADEHAKILMYLYNKRRVDAQNAGVVGFYLQEMLQCSDERFEFHKWYLKGKGFIALTEHGTMAITIQGVDHVISMSRTSKAEKLLITQSRDADESARPSTEMSRERRA